MYFYFVIAATSISVVLRCMYFFTRSTKTSSCFVKLFYTQSWRHRGVLTENADIHLSKYINLYKNKPLSLLYSECKVPAE